MSNHAPDTRQLVINKYSQADEVACLVEQVSSGLLAAEETIVEWYLSPQGCHVLDMGCGAGREALALLKRGYRVTAFDLTSDLVRAARQRLPRDGALSLSVADAVCLPLADDSVDHALMLQQMIHLIPGRRRRRQALAEALRVVRPGGTFTVSFYNRLGWAAPLSRIWQVAVRLYLGREARAAVYSATPPRSERQASSGESVRERAAQSRRRRLLRLLWWEVVRPFRAQWFWWKLNRGRRWQDDAGLEDRPEALEPGDQIALASEGQTDLYFHHYSYRELLGDARKAGWRIGHYWSLRELVHKRSLVHTLSWMGNPLYLVFRKGPAGGSGR